MSDLAVKQVFGNRAVPNKSKPAPIEHQFLDSDGNPIDMSVGTWTGEGRAEQLYVDTQPTGLGSGSVVVDDVSAIATYTWADEDFQTLGKFRIIIWVGNGTERYGSTVYEWDVADAPGADPTV